MSEVTTGPSPPCRLRYRDGRPCASCAPGSGDATYELLVDDEPVEREENGWVSRLWEPAELAGLLREAGFADVRTTKAFSDEATDGSERIVSLAATRPA